MAGELVLVVDDDADLGAILVELLQSRGLNVWLAVTVHEAMAALRRRTPALVLLDWFLPDGPPDEVVHYCKRRGVPVVLSSASSEAELRAHEIGAAAILPKPFDMDTFFRIIDEKLGREAHPHS